MTYQVIARKWRPQKFSELVGQDHITTTLKNAIRLGRTAHAYLFVGPRGIGKTTSARIFAKALNCSNPKDGEPCCSCQSCVSIAKGNSIDVIEIDAASQNSVDNMRDLRDEVMFTPVNSRFKVYIIDEVHMLSPGAWNALLKTVEEPPPHAKFLFATTEAHKVLPTIISRCQRFDLRRIPTNLIAERLNEIAQTENVSISQRAVNAIARAADGGMRDGQSLLDQMISFFGADAEQEVSEEQILTLFGLTAIEDMDAMIIALIQNDKGGLVNMIHHLSTQGKNLEKLFDDTLAYLRGIQITQLVDEPAQILETGEEMVARYKQIGESCHADVVQRLLEVLSPTGRVLHDALNKQVFIESIFLKAMRTAHAVQIQDLVERLNQIRGKGELEVLDHPKLQHPLKQQAPHPPPLSKPASVPSSSPHSVQPQAPAVQPQAPASQSQESQEKQVQSTAAAQPAPPKPSPSSSPPQNTQSSSTQPTQQSSIPDNQRQTQTQTPISKPAQPDQQRTATPVNEDRNQAQAQAPEEPQATAPQPPRNESPKPVVEDAARDGSSNPVPPPDKEQVPSQNKNNDSGFQKTKQPLSPLRLWHLLMEDIEEHQHNPILKGFMMEGKPESFIDGKLTVSFDEEYEREHAKAVKKEIPLLINRGRSISGDRRMDIHVHLKEGIASIGEERPKDPEKFKEMMKQVEEKPFDKETMDLFDGTVVDVHA